MSSTSTSSPNPTSSPESNDHRVAILGTILALLAAVIVIGLVLIVLRMRKRKRRLRDGDTGRRKSHRYQGSVVLDKTHPATNIVPFGTPGIESHSFNHVPGEDMRIAIRRPDGAWDFTDPNDPFTPSGVSEIYPSATSTTRFVSNGTKNDVGSRSSLALSTMTHTTTATTEIMNAPSLYHSINMDSAFDSTTPPTFPPPTRQTLPRSASSISSGGGNGGYYYTQTRELRVVTPDIDLEMSDLPLPYPPPAYGQEPTTGLNATFRLDTKTPPRSGY